MGNNDINKTENILVKVDDNNIVYIDPNSVINDKKVEIRDIPSENMVVYVNLEADLIPRSVLNVNGSTGSVTGTTEIASGTVNFLRNSNGNDLDTSWTESFLQPKEFKGKGNNITNIFYESDASAQTFGIESITMTVKGYTVPQVTINFTDVRGKTLFESPANSPYKTLFHLPWPVFYLTVKGFFGKAIRYRLHLTKFTSKYNQANGNFEITCTFIGSTYAFLIDIPLVGAMNAPFMYGNENVVTKANNIKTKTVSVSRSSKGYAMLVSVYDEYKRKGLIPKDFPVKTLREVVTLAKSLDETLENIILKSDVKPQIWSGLISFENTINSFIDALNGWESTYLNNNQTRRDTGKGTDLYKKLVDSQAGSDVKINGKDVDSLQSIITRYTDLLNKNKILTQNLSDATFTSSNFKKQVFSYINSIGDSVKNYIFLDKTNASIWVNIGSLKYKVQNIYNQFSMQKNKFEQQIEKLMNSIIKNKNKGFGFDPTIRNIFAVICANADVYIRLLKDVHTRAFNVGSERLEYLKNYTDETVGGKDIFPWPQIKKQSKNNTQKEFAYPGDKSLRSILQSNNARLWPEVEFVEEYEKVATKKVDNLANKEAGVNNIDFKYELDKDKVEIKPISTFLNVGSFLPYYDKSIASVIYEIYERGAAVSFYDTFGTYATDTDVLMSLTDIELDNITTSFYEDYTISSILKDLNTFSTTNSTPEAVSTSLNGLLEKYSPNERYPYYLDNYSTTDYIKFANSTSFKIEQNIVTNTQTTSHDDTSFVKLNNALKNYSAAVINDNKPSYRNYVYPFNSPTYLSYLGQTNVDITDLHLYNTFSGNTENEGFIKTPLNVNAWVNDTTNIFSKNLILDNNNSINILNTPFFHNQLLNDFINNKPYGRYAGAAYLLLNSLQFKDLQDLILLGDMPIRMSHLFKELGSTHYVPYHLILKWGALYHRHKIYTQSNGQIDILSGVTTGNTNNIIGPNLKTMFIGSETDPSKTEYNVQDETLNWYSGITSVGFNPFYEAVFHQIVNGYPHFSILDTTTYQSNIDRKLIYSDYTTINGYTYWSNFVDNSKYNDGADNFYTIVPSCGNNETKNLPKSSPTHNIQDDGFKIVLVNEYIPIILEGQTFPSSTQYNLSYDTGHTYDKQYRLYGSYREISDLIGTFSPEILNQFETLFLQFASEKENTEYPQKSFDDYTIIINENNDTETHVVTYQSFQEILKDIVIVQKLDSDKDGYNSILDILKTRQKDNFTNITELILSEDNMLKFTLGNPKEYDIHNFEAFARGTQLYPFGFFDQTQVSGQTYDYIKLYCGKEDSDLKYLNFFSYNNIAYTEDNVINLRPLIFMWAGYLQNGGLESSISFKQYIIDNILTPYDIRKQTYFRNLLPKFKDRMKNNSSDKLLTLSDGYGMNLLKQQSYDYFKTFNDKWSSGNSIGQRTLLEEFLFLDKANRDIGNKAYITLEKIASFENAAEDKSSLFSALVAMLHGTDFDLRGMPAYVNFYGTDFSKSGKIAPSKKVAKDIFGTYLEVDYQESTPKIILQYVGATAKHPDGMQDISKEKYLFNDDSFKIYDPINNPLRVTIPDVFDPAILGNSNRVVGFEVNVGDQNQSMFKSVTLDQESLRNTSEFFNALENISRSESGAATYSVDSNLFDLYRMRSYTCTVVSMGNVMIQPTMYFYIKNIPMFRGTYWITDVSHDIKPNSVTTTFKGVRMNKAALPDPEDSFMSSYRIYFQRILNKATAKQSQNSTTTTDTTVKSNKTSAAVATIPTSPSLAKFEQQVSQIGIDTKYGIRYNGYKGEKYILKVNINGEEWYKATAVLMGGKNYPISAPTEMAVLNRLPTNSTPSIVDNSKYFTNQKIKWNDIQNYNNNYFFSLRFDLTSKEVDPFVATNLIQAKTEFWNAGDKGKGTDITVEGTTLGVNSIITPDAVKGAIHAGPKPSVNYGIGLSKGLMNALKLKDGDPVLFKLY
jgi:hypothetical protein